MRKLVFFLCAGFAVSPLNGALAGTTIPLTVNLSESVTVTGTPGVAVDVGGQTRYATYSAGSGTSALTFTLSPQAGDVDLDGIAVSSPIDLNGGTMKDAAGNNATLTFTPPNTSGIKVNYPSLGMDFVYDADGRYTLNGTVYNDLTSFLAATGGSFTRASTATYFDSTGTLQTAASGVPRFDYDPITHAAKGILIEESRTNLLIRSREADSVAWGKISASIVADTALAPDGTTTADKLMEDTALFNHRALLSAGSLTGTYTYSIYLKSAGRAWVVLNFDGPGYGAYFDIQTGAVGTITNAVITDAKITSVGNGWYRCSITRNISGISTSGAVYLATGDGIFNYTGDGTSGVYLWGAQLEQGSFATSYIPTTTATVTRAADVFSIPTAGWFNPAETSLVASAQIFGKSSGGRFQFGLGVNGSNYLGFPYVDSLSFLSSAYYRAAGAGPVIDPPDLSFYTLYKAGYAFSTIASTSSYSLNGVLSGTGSGVAPMSGTPTLTLGYAPFNLNQASGYIERLKYYPTRIADTQLQLLTQ